MAGVAAITVICYLAATAVKQTPLANKWLPSICGALGGLLGGAAVDHNRAAVPAAPPPPPARGGGLLPGWGRAGRVLIR